jgi:NAD(P)-dependent dehydrogenase (short-subunit alcohol dehydrogenase family)
MSENQVCVITGGGSGMGLAAAGYMPKDRKIVLSGRTEKKLSGAVSRLKEMGYDAYPFSCDVSDRASVRRLAEYAASLGEIKNVIHAAGLSPAMAKPEQLLRVNALGTVYVNQEFSRKMNEGSVIVDVASNSAYVLPRFLISEKTYRLAETSEDKFLAKCLKKSNLAKSDYEKSGFAYALSKNFAVWYAKKSAFELGEKGIRVASLSPGLIDTDMGELEAKEGGDMLQYGAVKRMGRAEELGYAIATVADERNGYLAGVDILCDGGCTTGKKFKR